MDPNEFKGLGKALRRIIATASSSLLTLWAQIHLPSVWPIIERLILDWSTVNLGSNCVTIVLLSSIKYRNSGELLRSKLNTNDTKCIAYIMWALSKHEGPYFEQEHLKRLNDKRLVQVSKGSLFWPCELSKMFEEFADERGSKYRAQAFAPN